MRTTLVHVDDNLAFSPMPSPEDIPELARRFNLVVIACEEYELEYDKSLWVEHGVEYVEVPVPDYRAPPLVSSRLALERVLEAIENGKRVLIHCRGGRGRSATLAAAYLVHRYDLSAREAIEMVRSRVRGAIETRSQEVFVHVYKVLLKTLSRREVEAIGRLGARYDWGRGEMHASYVAMHSVRIFEQLAGILRLARDELKPLVAAALLHDIGLVRGEPHNEHSYDIIRDAPELDVLGTSPKHLAALTALHHRREGDPRKDPRCSGVAELVARLAAILKVADALDYGLNQVVEDVEAHVTDDELILQLYCEGDCSLEAERAEEKAWLLEDLTGRRVQVQIL